MRWCAYILMVAWISQLLYLWPLPPTQADSFVRALAQSIDRLAEIPPENEDFKQEREEILVEVEDARNWVSSNPGVLEEDLWFWWFVHLAIILVGVLFAVFCLYRKWYAALGTVVATYLFIDIVAEPWLLWEASGSVSSLFGLLWRLATSAGIHIFYVSFLLPLVLISMSIVVMFLTVFGGRFPGESASQQGI